MRRFGFGQHRRCRPHKTGRAFREFTREIAKGSRRSTSRQSLRPKSLDDTRAALDAVLLDNVAADAVRPHGLRYNPFTSAIIAGLTPSAATNLVEKIAADIRALVVAVQPASQHRACIVNPAQAASIALALPIESAAITVIASASQTAGTVLAIDFDGFVVGERACRNFR